MLCQSRDLNLAIIPCPSSTLLPITPQWLCNASSSSAERKIRMPFLEPGLKNAWVLKSGSGMGSCSLVQIQYSSVSPSFFYLPEMNQDLLFNQMYHIIWDPKSGLQGSTWTLEIVLECIPCPYTVCTFCSDMLFRTPKRHFSEAWERLIDSQKFFWIPLKILR